MQRSVSTLLLLVGLFLAGNALPLLAAEKGQTFSPSPAMRMETLAAYSRPESSLTLSSEVSARVLEVFADVGDPVPANGLFARLDPIYARLDIDELRIELRKTASRRDYLETEAGRFRDLVKGRHSDQSTLDKLEQDLEQATLQLESLRVAIERAEERLARHNITAPSGFIIMERMIEPGEWVTQGQSLATIGDFTTLVAPFALDEEQFQWLRRNKATLVLHSAHGSEVQARLHQVSPAFDPETRKINVELAFSPDDMEARGGQRLELRLKLPERTGAVTVPASSLQKRYEQYWLTTPDGERRKVVLMGAEPDGTMRVFAPDLSAEQPFLLHPQSAGDAEIQSAPQAPDDRQGS